MDERAREKWWLDWRTQAQGALDSSPGLDGQLRESKLQCAELELQNEELRRSQAELLEVLDRYQGLLSATPLGCLRLDEGGRILDANPVAGRLLARSETELVGARASAFLCAEDAQNLQAQQERVLSTGEVQTFCAVLEDALGGRTSTRLELASAGCAASAEPLFWLFMSPDRPAGDRASAADGSCHEMAEKFEKLLTVIGLRSELMARRGDRTSHDRDIRAIREALERAKRVTLELRLLRETSWHCPTAGLPEVQAPQDGDSKSCGPVILVVDDEGAIRTAIRRILHSEGYRVVALARGEEALALAGQSEQRIDLLLTDLSMPTMNGHVLCERMRKLRPQVPRLYMSGHAVSVDVEKGDVLLKKPFHPHELVEAIQACLSRRR